MGCAARSRQGLVESLSSRYHACRTESTPHHRCLRSGISHDVCHVLFIHLSRQITSHVFHTQSHIAHNKTQDARQPGANTTRDARLTLVHYRIYGNRARSTTRYLSIQYSEHSGQTREKQKAKRVKHSHRAAGGAAGSSSWRRRQETSDISRYRRESSIPCGVRVAAALVGAGSPR